MTHHKHPSAGPDRQLRLPIPTETERARVIALAAQLAPLVEQLRPLVTEAQTIAERARRVTADLLADLAAVWPAPVGIEAADGLAATVSALVGLDLLNDVLVGLGDWTEM